jgi:hypothetical protein
MGALRYGSRVYIILFTTAMLALWSAFVYRAVRFVMDRLVSEQAKLYI